MDALLALMAENDQESFSRGDFQLTKLRDFINPSGSNSFFNQASNWLSAANHSWDKWIVNYDFEQQKKLLQQLGLDSERQYLVLTIILVSILGVVLLVIVFILRPKKAQKTPLDLAYSQLKHSLEKAGLELQNNDGPYTLKNKAINAFPRSETDITQIYQYYIEGKYQNNLNNLERLKTAVKKFKPQ